ncbi:Large-conductance mechanosensitive channel [Lentibacillus sp. JNUCC-1]|nr:Large-conductance mechanosensitive channel [Lentibacillus sp. JNUCC-1]
MWNEFKEFAVRGNVMDLAIAVVIGAAFGKVVSSLVENIMTPLLSLVLDVVDVSHLFFTIGHTDILYGEFMQSILDFVFISMATFFLVRLINRFRKEEEKKAKTKENPEVKVLKEIRELLKQDQKPTHVSQKHMVINIAGRKDEHNRTL